MTGEHVGLDSTAAEELFPANATPASANQVRHTPANARGNKSTDVSLGGYAEERHYLWSFVSVATVRKRVEPMRLGLCVAPCDSRHRASAGGRSSPGPP